MDATLQTPWSLSILYPLPQSSRSTPNIDLTKQTSIIQGLVTYLGSYLTLPSAFRCGHKSAAPLVLNGTVDGFVSCLLFGAPQLPDLGLHFQNPSRPRLLHLAI